MADPQAQNAGTATPAQTPPPDSGGVDLSGIRVRTLQQAKAELPQPKITPPWEEEPRLPEPSTTKLGKAYDVAKSWLSEQEQHLSEKYLAPFRTGIDRMADDIEGSPYVKAASPNAKGAVYALTNALRSVPVGSDVKSTVLANVIPPELGPEGKALSKEIKAGGQAAEKVAPNLEGLRTREVVPAPQ